MRIIDKVGLEVEGGWPGEQRVPPFDDLDLVEDRSIDGQTLARDKPMLSPHVGEAVSKPIPPEEAEAWIKKYWPNETNKTCGYHIHVSLVEPLYYMLLTKKRFAFTVIREMERLGKHIKLPNNHYLWERLSGNNPFCTLSFDASTQMDIKAKRVGMRVRYGFLNFAKNIHGTVEFRALPTFDSVDHALLFTKKYFETVEEFVKGELEKRQDRSLSIVDEDGLVRTYNKRF